MNLAMPWWSKAVCGLIGIFITVTGGLVTALEWNDHRMDAKDAQVKTELIQIMDARKAVRDVEIKAMGENISLQISNLTDKVADLSEDVKAVYRLGKKIDGKVTVVQEPKDLYTKIKSEDSPVEGSL